MSYGLKLLFVVYQYYNNIQNISKMNFYTLMPNGYANILRAPIAPSPQPRTNTPLILSALGEALKISISNYGTTFQHAIVMKKPQPQQLSSELSERVIKKTVSKRIELKAENAQFQKIIEKEIISEKVNHKIGKTSKGKQNSVQNITNDQPSYSNNEAQQSNKKQDSIIKLKKDKNRNKKDFRSVSVPEVCLVLAAEISEPSFTQLQLKKKKESLFRRQVLTWDQKVKNRRDKREIRMLGC